MAEVAIKLTGQDNLSNTIKKVKSEVNSMKDAVNNIDAQNLRKLNNQFESTISSGKSVNSQLSQIKRMITEMNYKGLDGTPEMQKMIDKAKELQAALAKTKEQLGDVGKSSGSGDLFSSISGGISKLTGINLDGIKSQFDSVTGGISSVSEKLGIGITDLGKFTAVGVGVAAVATAVYKITDAWMDYNNKLQEATNLTKQFTGTGGEEMQSIRNKALAIVDVYGGDFKETMKAANNLVKQYGVSWDESFQLIQDGYNTGANANGDMLDQISEYSTYMKQAGVSAEQMVSILQTGQSQGILSDKALDTIKEGDLRIREMSKSTKEALEGIGIDADSMAKKLESGSMTTMQAMQQISEKMREIPEDSQVMQAAVSDIFGGPGEDAGIAYLQMLSQIPPTLESAKQANEGYVSGMERQVEATTNLKNAFSSLFDFTDSGFESIKATLMESVYEPTTQILEAFGDSDSITEFGQQIQDVCAVAVEIFGDVYEAIADVIEVVVDICDSFGLLDTTTGALAVAIGVLKGAWEAIKLVWDAVIIVVNWVIRLWNELKNLVLTNINNIPLIQTVKEGIETIISWVKSAIEWWNKLTKAVADYKKEQQDANTGDQKKPEQPKTNVNTNSGNQTNSGGNKTKKTVTTTSSDSGKKNKTTKTTTQKTNKTTKSTKQDEPVAGSLGANEKQLADLQNKLKNGILPNSDEIQKTISDLKSRIEQQQIELGIKVDPKVEENKKKAEELKKNLEKATETEAKLTPYQEKKSSFDTATGKDESQLQKIQQEMNYNDQLMDKLNELKETYQELGNVDGIDRITEKIEKLKEKQGELGEQAKTITTQQNNWDKQKESLQSYGQAASAVGGVFSSLGSAFSAAGSESAAAVMQMVSTTASGVAQMIPQILALIGAKQGEAMASGTASAASLPYPANIAAIASIIATVVATFASIMSAMGAFAGGGIVGGGSFTGDHNIARVNSGEMILNGTQQRRLFDTLNGKGVLGGEPTMSSISWKIKGSDLYGTLRNYSKTASKTGKVTGIK